jgi:hypothetical protein
MILASHGLIASQIASFDADAAAFFARVTTDGGTLSATEKIATNQLVLDLKANSLWTLMKAIYPMVGGSSSACKQNLKSSSFTGTFTSGWTFSSSGAKSNGTSAYFNTNLNWNTYTDLNNAAFGAYWTDWKIAGEPPLGNAQYYGVLSGSNLALIRGLNGTSDNYINNSSSGQIYSAGNGLHAMSRINSTQVTHYLNTNVNTQSAASTGKANLNFYFGGGNGITTFQYYNIAFGFISEGFNTTQWTNFYTAVQAFQTTLGRQV